MWFVFCDTIPFLCTEEHKFVTGIKFMNRKRPRNQLIDDIFGNTSQELQFAKASTRHLLYLKNEWALLKIFILDDIV